MPVRISETMKRLLYVYVGVFVVQSVIDQLMGGNFRGWFALVPAGVLNGKIWQVFTYSFLHADVMHLVLNMMVLVFVGSDIEAVWGRRKMLVYYFYCTTMAGLFYLVMQLLMYNPLSLVLPMVGASGGIYGLLLAYGILFPDREMLFMMFLPMKAKQFIWVIAGIEFLQTLYSGQGRLSAIAHLSGMGAGFLFMYLQAKGFQLKKPKATPAAKKKPSHLRLVKDEHDDDDDRPPRTWH
jgi:membrane associated rhomboid family serine protease